MRVVMALGGNALLRRGEPMEAEVQQRNILTAVAKSVAPIARQHQVVVTHGNGPQIGLLALQAAAYKDVRPYPLDVLGAETEGMIGYLIEQALANELPGREIATLLTLVDIAEDDPAFSHPSKPIGPVYSEADMRQLAARTSWTFVADGGGFRRAVPSPIPRQIREIKAIEILVQAGVTVICAGGGGIPVVTTPNGGLRGVEAVVDKDMAAALLAEQLNADFLLLLTDVPGVWPNWPQRQDQPIRSITPTELLTFRFDPGSMAPKTAAACQFATRTGRPAGIGAIEQAERILAGSAGTVVAIRP